MKHKSEIIENAGGFYVISAYSNLSKILQRTQYGVTPLIHFFVPPTPLGTFPRSLEGPLPRIGRFWFMAALPPSPSLSIVSSVPLRDTCTRIPLLGLGSSHQQGGLTAQAVRAALDNGIRLIDTAQRYLCGVII